MNEAQKRLFSVAFGVANTLVKNCRKQQRLEDEADDEFMVVLSQFTLM